MEMVLISKGKEHVVLYDEEKHGIVSMYSWSITKNGYVKGRIMSKYGDDRKEFLMHRLLLGIEKNNDVFCDHINRVRTDNRGFNLRICTRKENNRNRTASGKSIYLGVSPVHRKSCFKYVAKIYIENRQVVLGAFDTEIDAAIAYDNAARLNYGRFASLNFPHLLIDTPKRLDLRKIPRGRSKYIGVSVQKRVRGFVAIASISINNRRTHIGCFNTEEAAAHAYNEAALKFHGDKAVLNPV